MQPNKRIVSLLASATEIVCALGAGEMLVARSHECDNPDWVRQLPSCSEPAFDVSVSSMEIDTEVRRRIRSGEPLYHIDGDLIRDLRPDLLITQAHCEVCAVTPGDMERSSACTLTAQQIALSASSLDDIFEEYSARYHKRWACRSRARRLSFASNSAWIWSEKRLRVSAGQPW